MAIRIRGTLITMSQVVGRPACRKCGGNILRGQEVWEVESKGLFREGGFYHKECKPPFDKIVRKIPTKKARESFIRKQLREDGVCYRGTVRVSEQNPGSRLYTVERRYGAGRPDAENGCKLLHVVQILLTEEYRTINNDPLPLGGGDRHCDVCIKKTFCEKSGFLPCEQFGVKPPTPPVNEPSPQPQLAEESFKDLTKIVRDLRQAVKNNEAFNRTLLDLAYRIEGVLEPSLYEVNIDCSNVGEKIKAIKALRNITHCSLKEAKDTVDRGTFRCHFVVAQKLVDTIDEMGGSATMKKVE